MARSLIKLNPEIEEIDYDDEKGTITLRDKETGKTVTVNYDEIKDGKLSFLGDDGENVSIDAKGAADGNPITVTTDDGSITMNADTEDLPDWIPLAKCMKVTGHQKIETDETIGGSVFGTSSKSVKETTGEFRKLLEKENYKIEEISTADQDGEMGMLIGVIKETNQNVKVTVGVEDEETFIIFVYSKENK